MIYSSFSPKQLQAMLWWSLPETKKCDAIVCDGSVRSGKTMAMSVGFMLWSMKTFDKKDFALCGKTIASLRRNVVEPFKNWIEGIVKPKINYSRNYMEIKWLGHKNRYYFFGGKDESSASLIQGMTLAGVLFDEVALMPQSFVNQAIARCSVTGSKLWFNCNPNGSEEHWFYKEWIDEINGKAKDKNRLHLHFTMDDNFSLSDDIRQRYERMYSGVFYERYILGMWVLAEGLVYPQFDKGVHVVSNYEPSKDAMYYISIDYGTVNPCSMGLWALEDSKAVRIKEFYYDSKKQGDRRTDEEHYQSLVELAKGYDIYQVIVDPSAASFISCIRKHGDFIVRSANNSVIDGVRTTGTLLSQGRLLFSDTCKDSIREFSLYRWDEEKTEDTVIKENDHAMDDIRYFCYTILKFNYWLDK